MQEATTMEAAVEAANWEAALSAVERNRGAPGPDGMKVEQLRGHLAKHGVGIKAKLLKGSFKPSPARRNVHPQTQWRHPAIEHPQRAGSLRAATAAPSDPAAGRAALQRQQPRVPTRTQRAWSHRGRTAARTRREGMGGGHGHHQVDSHSLTPAGQPMAVCLAALGSSTK